MAGGLPYLARKMGAHCAWPLEPWDGVPPESRFVCGEPIVEGAKGSGREYCPHHRGLAAGKGTPSERNAIRSAEAAAGVGKARAA